jgi:ketosteroid isomerase-like protein
MGTNSGKLKKQLTLQDLIDRAEIHDVIMRYCRSVDRADFELMTSCFHPDAVVGFPDDVYIGKGDGFITFLRGELATFDSSSHFVGNLLIELEGDVAYTETYLIGCVKSLPAHKWGGDFVTVWGRYINRLERRDGEWRIASHKLVLDWQRKDEAGGWREIPPEQLGRRDGTDPSQLR